MGTNVRLDTPEEIAAWIAERKRRWPSAGRVAEKKRKLEEAMANGELHPEHLVLKRFRPPLSSDVGLPRMSRGRGGAFGGSGRGRGRGRGGGGQNRRHGINASRGDITTSAQSRSQSQSQSQTQPSPLPTSKGTNPRSSAQRPPIVELSHLGSDADSDSGSGDEAPEVLSAKRPPGIDTYASSSDAEPELPQAVNTHSRSEPADPSSGNSGLATTAGPESTPAKVESINRPRRALPPQPKRPPRNPFAPRSSLLRNLLLPEIRMTVSNLSQAIRFLVDNDFLENVELKAGEANEKRIEVVGEQLNQPEADTGTLEEKEPKNQ